MQTRTNTHALSPLKRDKRLAKAPMGVQAVPHISRKAAQKARLLRELEGAIAQVKAHIRGEIKLPDISQLFDEFKEL